MVLLEYFVDIHEKSGNKLNEVNRRKHHILALSEQENGHLAVSILRMKRFPAETKHWLAEPGSNPV
jgi:hypothetical protein